MPDNPKKEETEPQLFVPASAARAPKTHHSSAASEDPGSVREKHKAQFTTSAARQEFLDDLGVAALASTKSWTLS